MKKLCSIFLCLIVLFTHVGYGFAEGNADLPDVELPAEESYTGMDDPALLQRVEDNVYANLEAELGSDNYVIEDISTVYISQEYLEEVAFNTKSNLYFGYSLADLNAAFEGKRYIFTCGEDGQTTVQEFEQFPDNSDTVMLKNIAIGTGVILVCVTVSIATAGIGTGAAVAGGTTKLSMIFAASAKTAAKMAVSGAIMSSATAAVTRGIESGGDVCETLRAAKLSASEGFKWGAISGAIVGGAKEAIKIHRASKQTVQTQTAQGQAAQTQTTVPTPKEAQNQVYKAFQCSEEEVTFLNGERVPYATSGGSRIDCIRYIDGHMEAIEVKCYDLKNDFSGLQNVLKKQVSNMTLNLPEGSTQRVVLNVTGRGYDKAFVENVLLKLHNALDGLCPGIQIDYFGGVL